MPYPCTAGHATAVGHRTKKCVGYAWRSKNCRVCQAAKSKGKIARVHGCVHNWSGSSKAMEPDMVVEMVKSMESGGVSVSSIVGDEDTTTIHKLHSELGSNITKRSDMNHLKKTVGNQLYELKKRHKALSPMVISYLQKLYSYTVKQNQGDPEGVANGLRAAVSHAFGKHDNCNVKWCRYSVDPQGYRFKSLPNGKPLSGESMQKDLEALFEKHALQADKLSNIGSTQPNESLNMTIASKAPKTKHFSGSGALSRRIQAGVAQKNMGYRYVSSVGYIDKVNSYSYFSLFIHLHSFLCFSDYLFFLTLSFFRLLTVFITCLSHVHGG